MVVGRIGGLLEHVAAGQFGGPEGAGNFVMVGDDDGFAGDGLESRDDGAVKGGAALEEDALTDAAVPDDAI